MRISLYLLLLGMGTLGCTDRGQSQEASEPDPMLWYEGLKLYDTKANLLAVLGEPDDITVQETTQVNQGGMLEDLATADSTWKKAGPVIRYEYYHYSLGKGAMEFVVGEDSAFVMNIDLPGSGIEIVYRNKTLTSATEFAELADWPEFTAGTKTEPDGTQYELLQFDKPIVEHTPDAYLIDFY
ncbi:MAG: hypothetical protein AAFQ98_17025, partial [Bacteroidota bacterium]